MQKNVSLSLKKIMTEELEITGRKILKNILGQLKTGNNAEYVTIMNYIHTSKKVQMQPEKEELHSFPRIYSYRHTKRIFSYIKKLEKSNPYGWIE